VRAYNIARRMRTGNVMINTTAGGGGLNPWATFGGYKHSGLGREWGAAGMESTWKPSRSPGRPATLRQRPPTLSSSSSPDRLRPRT